MTRLAAVLCLGLGFSPAAFADDFSAWRAGAEAAGIEGDPWRDRTGFVPEDAYVFGEVAQHASLGPDAVAVAVRADLDRLAPHAGDPARPTAALGRVAAAFDRFAPVGADGRAYASLELARGRSGPATLTREVTLQPAVLAMSAPHR